MPVRPSRKARADNCLVISSFSACTATGRSRRGRGAHTFVEREIVRAWKFGQAGVGHEGFEADGSAVRKFFQRVHVAGDQAAPEREIGE